MFKSTAMKARPQIQAFRSLHMKNEVSLSNRRAARKIRPGKARPAIFYQFDTLVELSDGSVIKRTSQAPKDEIRMINDQRNSPLWNPNRSDLISVDAHAADKINKFKERFASFDKFETEDDKKRQIIEGKEVSDHDDYLELMGENVVDVQKGGQVFSRKQERDKGKKKK